jgi:TRAP-type uncharacterized transport system substrate-binding protein
MPLDPQRALQLRFQGDWGGANLTRICGWLAGEVFRRCGAGTRSTIRTGRGMGDNLVAVARGEVDVAVATPAGFARMAVAGQGPFAQEPLDGLRAIGSLPHRDALLVAVPAERGIRTFAELRERRPALRLTTGPDDGESFMGLGAAAAFAASGVPLSNIPDWGGELLECEQPRDCVALMLDGRADAIAQEAIMTPWWQDLATARPLTFLSLDDQAADHLQRELSLGTVTVEPGYLPGLDAPVRALDFRDWMVVVRQDMRDDVAALLAAIMVEASEALERQYRHIPVRFSPLDYPITPARLADTPIALHPGAGAYFDSVGALGASLGP